MEVHVTRFTLLGAAVLLGAGMTVIHTSPSQAQNGASMSEAHREIQHLTIRTQRDLLLRMIDSMPAPLLRRATHVGRRDFAQQVHHAAVSISDALGRILQIPPPTWQDTSVALASKDGLRLAVNVSFDFIDSVLTAQSIDVRQQRVPFAGREIYKWQLFDEINEHTLWTAGQLVGNFRDANLTPPQFKFF